MATSNSPTDGGRELVLAVIGTHAASLLAVARRHSLCADDAYDAYQRSLEIFLRRADSVDPATAPAWLRTVVKHEAMAVRASRQRIVGPVEVDMDRAEAREVLPAEERVAAGERDARSAEALARLKPQEVRALVLKARGYSYREIGEITGWTYTKVNRCLTEGRRAFLDRVADIEAGRECERWAGTLSALADGEASAGDLAAARPHLRHCPACRATLGEFRRAPHAVAALAPAPVLLGASGEAVASPVAGSAPGDDGLSGLLARLHDAVVGGWHERAALSAHKVQASLEAASAGKLAAVAASATALAGGGAAALTGADA
ncbi:MAG TPA: sigma-70 family RNA polymerase sigma factor, partial [Solirubrobacteraceae bacterium]|nr:sigma-70 family RNA polymerase sigma factor [Solirubrobacteraceae bacterium]